MSTVITGGGGSSGEKRKRGGALPGSGFVPDENLTPAEASAETARFAELAAAGDILRAQLRENTSVLVKLEKTSAPPAVLAPPTAPPRSVFIPDSTLSPDEASAEKARFAELAASSTSLRAKIAENLVARQVMVKEEAAEGAEAIAPSAGAGGIHFIFAQQSKRQRVSQRAGLKSVGGGGTPDGGAGGGGGRRAGGSSITQCNHDGCTKQARRPTRFCVRHGGGRRCVALDCTKAAAGQTDKCVAHGGGKRCQAPGCTKASQCAAGLCKAHGGGRRCIEPGCRKSAQGRTGMCRAHAVAHKLVDHSGLKLESSAAGMASMAGMAGMASMAAGGMAGTAALPMNTDMMARSAAPVDLASSLSEPVSKRCGLATPHTHAYFASVAHRPQCASAIALL